MTTPIRQKHTHHHCPLTNGLFYYSVLLKGQLSVEDNEKQYVSNYWNPNLIKYKCIYESHRREEKGMHEANNTI